MRRDEPRIVTIGSFAGAWKWHGGVVANDNKVYCIPCSGTSVLAIDAACGTVETFGNVGGPQAYKWNRACVCERTGKLYAMPSHHPSGALAMPLTQHLLKPLARRHHVTHSICVCGQCS